MKKYYFYMIEEDFYDLFKGDNLKAFLELFFRKEENSYYTKQFGLFVKELDLNNIKEIISNKFSCRKDFCLENNKMTLDNYITSNKEIMVLHHNCIVVDSDYEVSPFINSLSDNFPDLVAIDVNNYKIERVGLVTSKEIR